MHSTAYAHQIKKGDWEVRLPIPGHLLSDKHPTLHKTKEAADLWIAVPTAASGKNRNSLNIRRANRPYLVASVAAAYAPTRAIRFRPQQRISSEIWSMCSISSDPVFALVHHVFGFSWPIEGAAAHEQDVSRVDLQELLLRMLASALRRHRRDGAFHDLEEGLLYALARDVAGDRGVVGLAADLVDLVDIDDAALGALDVVVGGLQQLEDESRRATSPTRTCSPRG